MDPQPVGRDAEIAEILAFVSATSTAPAALVITGDTGIGKTVLLQHMVQAVSRSSRVLSCQPASAETPLAFSAVDDLLGDVAREVLPGLDWPRRRALEAALLLNATAEPSGAALSQASRRSPEPRALARGILDALRMLADDRPLVVAMDDAHWLDRPSASVLEFCFRRLGRAPLLILLTCRTDDSIPLGLDRALPADRLRRVRLGPLSLGAVGEIVRSRLGAALPRHALTKLYEACGGNPFYALESAQVLLDNPRISLSNEPLPIPRSLSDLVRRRMGKLTPAARRVGQLVAAASDPQERLIREACDEGESWAAIDQAVDAGVLERDGNALRFTHPLLRSVMYGEMTLSQRRSVHRRLAARTEDVEKRAWHLALGASRPSAEIAEVMDTAAREAAARGAPEAAAGLAEHAARMTPADRSDGADERIVRAADYHFRAGEIGRSRELIEAALAACSAGSLRAPLLIRLATIHYHQTGWPTAEETLRQAVQDAAADPALRAHAEQELAIARLVAGDLPDACRWAKASLCSAERAADPRLIAHSLARIATLEFLQGNGVRPDLLDRAEALEGPAGDESAWRVPLFGPGQARGLLLKWCDRLDDARLRLAGQYRHALEHGNEASLPFLLHHLSELECWAGNWDMAEEYALEGCRAAEEGRQQAMAPATLYSLALVRAHRGQVQDVHDIAGEALHLCERTGNIPVASQVASVLGFLAVSTDDHQAAHAHLGHLAEVTATLGLGEPSVVKFLPDEIEALSILGEVSLARSFTRQLEARGQSLGSVWAQATSARCRAHIAAMDGDLETAEAACQQAISQHELLPMPFELGRTLLIKGMIERRAKHKATARQSFGQALEIFEGLGAPLWAVKVRRELSKLATRPATGDLTQAEHRVAALIAQGRTNREIASIMFVTENTVQTHLRHIFAKLGVRSRTELTARLLSGPALRSGPATTAPSRSSVRGASTAVAVTSPPRAMPRSPDEYH
jgi:DNA-binding CsgD family transcriptional regulator/tetratricopeptide (TPR) repeat protein